MNRLGAFREENSHVCRVYIFTYGYKVMAFSLTGDKDVPLKLLNRTATHGRDPCYGENNKKKKFVFFFFSFFFPLTVFFVYVCVFFYFS